MRQQLRMRQLANEHQRRVTTQVRSQVWQPYASMDYAQYGGTPYWSNQNFGWSQHHNTSWNTSYTILHTPQVQRSSLDTKMVELEKVHAELVKENAKRSRSRVVIDYSQIGLPRFLDPNEISQPPQEIMTKLEATMVELERVYVECATSQVPLIEVTRANVQIQPMPFKSLKEEMAPMATSYTQLTFEKEQPKQEKSMSIQELVAKYTNENENMVEMHFKRQQVSLPSTLEVNIEE